MRPIFIAAAIEASFFLTCASCAYERRGPELAVVGNLCGPRMDELCYAPVLKGGFPLAYIYDNPNVSVEGSLFLGEDKLRPGAFMFDILANSAALLLLGEAVARIHAWRRRVREEREVHV